MKKGMVKKYLYSLIITTLLLSSCTAAATPLAQNAVETSVAVAAETEIESAETETVQSTEIIPSESATDGKIGAPSKGTPPANGKGSNPPQGTPPAGGKGGTPPEGTPPSGKGSIPSGENGSGASLPGGGDSSIALTTATGAYTVDGITASQSNQTYTASNADESGIYVLNGGNLTLKNVKITTSGDSSSTDASSFYGLNAGLLAAGASIVNISDSSVTTTGKGANGIFAYGENTKITLSNVSVNATGQVAHGIMASGGGTIIATDVNLVTSGTSSAPIATDRGGGTITVTGATVKTTGKSSPGIYSTDTISVTDADIVATNSEAVVIEGKNNATVTNTTLKGGANDYGSVLIVQTTSGDSAVGTANFTINQGSLTSVTGPLFFVTNTESVINLNQVALSVSSGVILNAAATERWGNSGSNGGDATINASDQTLTGDILADSISSVEVNLTNGSSLTGALNSANTASAMTLILDKTSSWSVTANSYLTCLTDTSGISGTSISNITGNGYTVYYNKSTCSSLAGKTYTLNNGGYLKPSN